VRAYSAAIFVRLGDVVGADRDQPAIANLHLTMELQQTFGLPAVFWAEGAAAKDEHHGILPLQLGEFSMFRGMVAELIVGENGSGHHVGSHVKSSIMWARKLSGFTPSQINHDVARRLRAANQHISVCRCIDRVRRQPIVPATSPVSRVWQTPACLISATGMQQAKLAAIAEIFPAPA
jgi:hypothetical protein